MSQILSFPMKQDTCLNHVAFASLILWRISFSGRFRGDRGSTIQKKGRHKSWFTLNDSGVCHAQHSFMTTKSWCCWNRWQLVNLANLARLNSIVLVGQNQIKHYYSTWSTDSLTGNWQSPGVVHLCKAVGRISNKLTWLNANGGLTS